jgi:two-component system response regulator FixJ
MYITHTVTISVMSVIMNNSIVYVIDDNKEFRASTTWMLEGAGYSVQGYSDPQLALEVIEKNYYERPGCILLDIRMPSMSGLELHDKLLLKKLRIPIIYMTGHGDVPLAVEAMSKGAVTLLEKPLNISLLKQAISKAVNQSIEFQNHYGVRENSEQYKTFSSRFEKLTDREREVLQEIVAGKMNKVIAIDLGISVKTVELHRSRVMSKLKAKTPAELVKMYITESVT